MKKLILIIFAIVFLSSCSSININPITKTQAKNAHKPNNSIDGYIIYAPKVYISVVNLKNECKISTILMPDKERPFSIDIKEGIGKIDATINITDGWMLGNVSAKIDNTSVVGNIREILRVQGESGNNNIINSLNRTENLLDTDNNNVDKKTKKLIADLTKAIKEMVAELQKPICGIKSGIYSLDEISNSFLLEKVKN